jgi:hypothetical protein
VQFYAGKIDFLSGSKAVILEHFLSLPFDVEAPAIANLRVHMGSDVVVSGTMRLGPECVVGKDGVLQISDTGLLILMDATIDKSTNVTVAEGAAISFQPYAFDPVHTVISGVVAAMPGSTIDIQHSVYVSASGLMQLSGNVTVGCNVSTCAAHLILGEGM